MKDPYLKPVIFGGLLITVLSMIFAPAIFLWSIIGGYITTRLSHKITKELISLKDGLLLGALSGLVGGSCLDILTVFSFNDAENQRLLIRTLEKNWPKDLPLPDFKEMLPSLLITACIVIIIAALLFSVIGSYIGMVISNKKQDNKSEVLNNK